MYHFEPGNIGAITFPATIYFLLFSLKLIAKLFYVIIPQLLEHITCQLTYVEKLQIVKGINGASEK